MIKRNNLKKMVDINKSEGIFNIFDVTGKGRVMTQSEPQPYGTLDNIRYACVCFGYKFHYETPNHVYYREA